MQRVTISSTRFSRVTGIGTRAWGLLSEPRLGFRIEV